MRASATAVAVLAMLLVALAPTEFASEASPYDDLVAGNVYGTAPMVDFTIPEIPITGSGVPSIGKLNLTIGTGDLGNLTDLELMFKIHKRTLFDVPTELGNLTDSMPAFYDPGQNNSITNRSLTKTLVLGNLLSGIPQYPSVPVHVPFDAKWGIYFIEFNITWNSSGNASQFARSKGLTDNVTWARAVADIVAGKDVKLNGTDVDGVLPEPAFVVVTKDLVDVKAPNKVPDFGNYTTPVIRPGSTGTYNFTVTNRYNRTITDITVDIEVYMWATLEEAKTLDRLDGPSPTLNDTGTTHITQSCTRMTPGYWINVTVKIHTKDDTPKGTYFVKHRITFTYSGTEYVMSSRGHFSSSQWEGFNYTNLVYQLDVSGIVPDSSFSVKDPVPLWPLATLIGLCVFFGALAVVFYLAEEHGPEYPRLKKALQYWTGKFEQRRRLMKQRLDELRREVDVPLEDDEG